METIATTGTDLQRYYRWHAGVYDLSRWAFLFGRERLVQLVGQHLRPNRILEVGCGTGRNLERLATAFPEAQLVGVDLSADMLGRTRRRMARFGERVRLIEGAYGMVDLPGDRFDLIVFAYSLSMMNPGWERAINTAWSDLRETGAVAAVDFYASPVDAFKRWMAVNHVAMEAHLVERLDRHFDRRSVEFDRAYFGLWRYFVFLGQKLPALQKAEDLGPCSVSHSITTP